MNSFFKALNDSTRREILELLKQSDMTAGEIADKFQISKPSISRSPPGMALVGVTTCKFSIRMP